MHLANLPDFIIHTSMVVDYKSLAALGLEPNNLFLCCFHRDRVAELRSFCLKHPEYHIVSSLGGKMYLNRFAPGATLYFLAIGDSNPKVVYSSSSFGNVG